MRSAALLAFAALSVAAGCRSDNVVQPDVAELLPDSAVLHRLAVAIDHGDLATALSLVPELPAADLALSDSQMSTLDPDPLTWGPAQIRTWDVGVSIGTPGSTMENYAFAMLSHNGHMGEATLGAVMRDSRGAVVLEYPSRSITERNWWAPYLFKTLMHSTNLMPPSACGHSIAATGSVAAWYLPLLPQRYDLYYQGSTKVGYTARGKRADASQPACPTDDDEDGNDDNDDSGDGGGPAGNYYTINMCHYIDWYNADGTFMFTEFVGCEVIRIET